MRAWGVSSTALSGPISVWNGCTEYSSGQQYNPGEENGIYIAGNYIPQDTLTTGVVGGILDVATGGVFIGLSAASGANLYNLVLEGKGYTIKQQ